MQELIDKLKAEAGLTDEQAKQVLLILKDYVAEKYPMLAGISKRQKQYARVSCYLKGPCFYVEFLLPQFF